MSNEEALLDEVDLEQMEVEEDSMAEEEDNSPMLGDPDWTEHVLSMLHKDEVVKKNGAPRTEGLLRIARQLCPGLTFNKPEVHGVSEHYAAVTCCAVYDGCSFYGSAEVHSNNTDAPYNKYPLASAETRAIGRAVKRLLGINVITAEETSKVADLTIPSSDENRTEGSITSTQIKMVDSLSKKLDIGVRQVVTNILGHHESISELSHAEGLRVLEQLDAWTKNPSDVKFELYDPNWKTNF